MAEHNRTLFNQIWLGRLQGDFYVKSDLVTINANTAVVLRYLSSENLVFRVKLSFDILVQLLNEDGYTWQSNSIDWQIGDDVWTTPTQVRFSKLTDSQPIPPQQPNDNDDQDENDNTSNDNNDGMPMWQVVLIGVGVVAVVIVVFSVLFKKRRRNK